MSIIGIVGFFGELRAEPCGTRTNKSHDLLVTVDLVQHGPAAVQFYTKVKTVTERWPSGIKDGAEFVIPTMN